MSLSHDVPLAASLGHFIYVLGSIQRTGEKLLLQYNTRQGNVGTVWPEQRFFILMRKHSNSYNLSGYSVFGIFFLFLRLLVWTAPHPHQSWHRSPHSLFPGCHWQAACDWWKQRRECSDIILHSVTEMGTGQIFTLGYVYLQLKHHHVWCFNRAEVCIPHFSRCTGLRKWHLQDKELLQMTRSFYRV